MAKTFCGTTHAKITQPNPKPTQIITILFPHKARFVKQDISQHYRTQHCATTKPI
ncbi:hypothetical protein [Helicobacter typhlonius]|uniref:hypothetical protein n=1 Tax=Helicobacter typhlonius TaxID=76936 RepID=UPI002FDF367A